MSDRKFEAAMKDEIWTRNEIQSPCVRLCAIHPQERICVGCNRSIDEISNWSRMTDEARAEILVELPSRTARLRHRRGGRKARLEG